MGVSTESISSKFHVVLTKKRKKITEKNVDIFVEGIWILVVTRRVERSPVEKQWSYFS